MLPIEEVRQHVRGQFPWLRQNFVSNHVCGQFSWLWQNFELWPHFSKKWQSIHNGEFFKIEIFVLKYVLDHFKPIPTKRKFRPKHFAFAIFSSKIAKKEVFWRFLVEKKIWNNFLCPLLELFYCGCGSFLEPAIRTPPTLKFLCTQNRDICVSKLF